MEISILLSKNKIAKSYDFEDHENFEKLAINLQDTSRINEERRVASISSVDSRDPLHQSDINFKMFKTENNVKNFMNSMRIRKMYNKTASQNRRAKSENKYHRIDDSRIKVIKEHKDKCNEIIQSINNIDQTW